MEPAKKTYTQIVEELKNPIDQKALKELYGGSNLSSIDPAYVYERLNDVFGIDGWMYQVDIVREIEKGDKMYVVAKVTIRCRFGENGIVERCQYGGNMNPNDIGDSYKGAITDALTKCASMIYLAQDVYKGLQSHNKRAGAGVLKQQTTSKTDSSVSQPQNPAPSSKKTLAEYKETIGLVGWMKTKGTKYGELTEEEISKQIDYWQNRDRDDSAELHYTICTKLMSNSERYLEQRETLSHLKSNSFQK